MKPNKKYVVSLKTLESFLEFTSMLSIIFYTHVLMYMYVFVWAVRTNRSTLKR